MAPYGERKGEGRRGGVGLMSWLLLRKGRLIIALLLFLIYAIWQCKKDTQKDYSVTNCRLWWTHKRLLYSAEHIIMQ